MKNEEIVIKSYEKRYKEEVQNICIETAHEVFKSKDKHEKLLTAYCNYYIEQEPNNCFIAIKGDKVAGYILCAEDTIKWEEKFEELYVKKFKDSDMKNFLLGTTKTIFKYKDEYSAHLHIDILKEYQRMGIGIKLINALINHLKNKKIKNLMLVAGSDNINAINFYKKYGFYILDSNENETVMGIELK